MQRGDCRRKQVPHRHAIRNDIELEISMAAANNPLVSIIVPARNEEACLSPCLESLVAQTGISFEIVVVDDDSTDRTAEIARSFATREREGAASDVPHNPPSDSNDRGFSPSSVIVIPAGPLPDNRTGKNNAMSAGAKIAKGKWLLFTDADTVHQPGSLARAVAEAEQHGAALLSYSPAQELHGFWEKAVMPVIFAELVTTYPPQAVNGRELFFRYGGDAVRTRMYRSWSQMKEGWTKNLALLFPRPRALALLRMAEFLLIVGNLSAAIWAKFTGRPNIALQTALLTIILSGWFWMRIRKAHFPVGSNLVAILGLPVFSYLLIRSANLRSSARVVWKGREYASAQSNTQT